MGTEIEQEFADIILEKHNNRNNTHRNQLIEDRAQKPHLKNLRYKKPDDNKHHNADEHIQRARLPHQPIDIVEHQRYEQNIDQIFDSEFEEHPYDILSV